MSSASEANARWRKSHRKVIQLTVTPEENQAIRSAAANKQKSITRYLIDLAKKDIEEEENDAL